MRGRVLARGCILIWLVLPAVAAAQQPGDSLGGIVGEAAADAAAAADQRRDRVTGDETFQGGYNCVAPATASDAGPVICESRINPVLPVFYFALSWHIDDALDERAIDSIAIRRKGETEPFQTVSGVGSSVMPAFANNGFEMIDVNFDGFLDMRLMAQTSAGPNVLYRNWLWSQDEERFVGVAPLDEISSPEFDPEAQEILSRWRSSAAEGGVDIYIWEEEAPVLIHRETDTYSGPSRCTRSFFDRIDGELQKTGEGACG